MTDGLTEETAPPTPAPPEEGAPRSWRAAARVVLVVVAVAAGLGAAGGWLWYQWWGPPNQGSIYNTADGPMWYDLTDHGFAHQFDGPAQYAVIALGFGAVIGVLAAVLGRRQVFAALAAAIVGTVLAAYLAWLVGTTMSPPDPQRYATADNVCEKEPCEQYPAAIEVSGWTPFLCWPLGALAAFSATIFVQGSARELRRREADQQQAGTWLEPAKRGRSEQSPQQ